MNALLYPPIGRPRSRGFTLIELMIALAVAAVLASVALPAYRDLVGRNRVTAVTNELVGDLNYARSEATTRGDHVFVCPSVDHASCTGQTDWSRGWIVYGGSAAATGSGVSPLRRHDGVGASLSVSSNVKSTLRFDSSGFAGAGRTLTVRDDQGQARREVVVSATGRVQARRP